MSAEVELISTIAEKKSWTRPPIQMEFQVLKKKISLCFRVALYDNILSRMIKCITMRLMSEFRSQNLKQLKIWVPSLYDGSSWVGFFFMSILLLVIVLSSKGCCFFLLLLFFILLFFSNCSKRIININQSNENRKFSVIGFPFISRGWEQRKAIVPPWVQV